jgi:hypothetical protein
MHLHDIHDRLVENIKAAQDSQAYYYDTKHQKVEFEPSDMVWLNTSNISTSCPSKKLDWKCLGPYKVLKLYRTVSIQTCVASHDAPPS